MRRFLVIAFLAVLGASAIASDLQAQVFVRAPFVRVYVDGPNVQVRAPFVNFATARYYYAPGYPPGPVYVAPPRLLPPQSDSTPQGVPPAQEKFTPPPPTPKSEENPDRKPPQPVQPNKPLTLSEFAKTFEAKAGNYEVTLLNPVSNEATVVRFNLPEGTPRRVQVRSNQLVFDYGPRRFVRIEFDQDGAQVVSR
jgi:hypothetical protein